MKIEFADLGEWGAAQLFSEYDPQGPVIRINSRVADALPPEERVEFVQRAIAHEMYHHREHIGEIAVIADRAERERAAGLDKLDRGSSRAPNGASSP
jgi:hypothetical protein